jgi:hypothetical protein
MPRYAVYEKQQIRVVYFVEAENMDEAHDMVASMSASDHDGLVKVCGTDIEAERTQLETADGWIMVEA